MCIIFLNIFDSYIHTQNTWVEESYEIYQFARNCIKLYQFITIQLYFAIEFVAIISYDCIIKINENMQLIRLS